MIRLYFDWVKITLHHQHPLQLRIIPVLAIACRERGEREERGGRGEGEPRCQVRHDNTDASDATCNDILTSAK